MFFVCQKESSHELLNEVILLAMKSKPNDHGKKRKKSQKKKTEKKNKKRSIRGCQWLSTGQGQATEEAQASTILV